MSSMYLQHVPASNNVVYHATYNPPSIDIGDASVFMSTPEMVFLFGLTTLFLLAGIFATMLAFLVGKVVYHGRSSNSYRNYTTREEQGK